MGTAGVDLRTIARQVAGLIREHKTALRMEHLLSATGRHRGKQQEHFLCISLNGANEVIEKRTVTIGRLDRSQVHPRKVFADVIADRAAAVIFAHNHPSGDPKPRDADIAIHEQLTQAAKILGIRVLDHIIVTKTGHYSSREAGLNRA
jgi:DNA repair protein RadC